METTREIQSSYHFSAKIKKGAERDTVCSVMLVVRKYGKVNVINSQEGKKSRHEIESFSRNAILNITIMLNQNRKKSEGN